MTTIENDPHQADPMHRVVVGLDGSQASVRALEWAASEASRTGSILEGHASYDPGYVFISSDQVRMAMKKVLDEAAKHVAEIAPGVTFKGVAHEAHAAKVLVDASRGADLLVVGSRGLGGFSALLLGSIGQHCAVHAHCPVLIVRPTEMQNQAKVHP
jgi:nucleotide-binding universal stress UspA family protein